jgi:hypothetical protein
MVFFWCIVVPIPVPGPGPRKFLSNSASGIGQNTFKEIPRE